MNTKKMILLLVSLSFIFFSCKKDETNPNKEEKTSTKTHTISRATNYGNDWIYFSFSNGKEVEGVTEENKTKRLDWDIAFNKANMRLNCGTSGKGQGGAIKMDETDLDKLKTVPNSGYKIDEIGKITKDMSGYPPPKIESSLNKTLANAIKFSGPPPLYTINENVFAIKTADGKYVKMKITGYYNKEGKSGFVTFKYVYQKDGSNKF